MALISGISSPTSCLQNHKAGTFGDHCFVTCRGEFRPGTQLYLDVLEVCVPTIMDAWLTERQVVPGLYVRSMHNLASGFPSSLNGV
jgi:hypothetical protein